MPCLHTSIFEQGHLSFKCNSGSRLGFPDLGFFVDFICFPVNTSRRCRKVLVKRIQTILLVGSLLCLISCNRTDIIIEPPPPPQISSVEFDSIPTPEGNQIPTVMTKQPRITLHFTNAMDVTSVEDAYASVDLPASNVQFIWYAKHTVLTMAPKVELASATIYTFRFGTKARDVEGFVMVMSATFRFRTP
jgi:hypothetical protein